MRHTHPKKDQRHTSTLSEIRKKLTEAGGRWTGSRAKLIAVYCEHTRPLTVREAHRLAGESADLVSSYRTVRTLQKAGVMVAVDTTPEGERYELSDAYREHHHHLICTDCGSVEDFEDCFAERLSKKLVRRTRFRIAHHDLKFYGQCAECAA